VILGLNTETDHEAALKYAKKTFTYPVLLDAQKVREQYAVQVIPCTYLIDKEGRIAQRFVGYGEGMEKRLEAEAERLLAMAAEDGEKR
jgi:hypothetical protein